MPKGPRPLSKLELGRMARDREVYDLKAAGKDWAMIAQALGGINAETARTRYKRALRKWGWPALEDARHMAPGGDKQSLMVAAPEVAAAVTVAAAASALVDDDERFKALREACKAAGLKVGYVTSLIKRLKVGDYSPVAAEVKRLVGKDLLEALETKTSMALSYMDDVAMSQASLKDLSIATNILIEKQQLLKNQPTQIIDFTSRQQIGVLVPMLMSEAKRRGITVDGSATRVPE